MAINRKHLLPSMTLFRIHQHSSICISDNHHKMQSIQEKQRNFYECIFARGNELFLLSLLISFFIFQFEMIQKKHFF